MQLHRECLRRSTLTLAAALMIVVACQDAATPSERRNILRTSSRTSAPTPEAHRAVEAIHRGNPSDWVGREHNRILGEFKTRLAQPGVMTRRMCDYVVNFVTAADNGDERLRAITPRARREASEAGLATTKLCTNQNAMLLALPISNSIVRPKPQEVVLSAEASELANQVLAAIDASETSYYLAAKLSPVLNAAASLDSVERAVIEATISVAQSSYEYWEAELPAMEDRFYSDYNACLTQAYQAGYTEDSARDACLNGGIAVTEFLPQPRTLRSRELAVAGTASSSAMRVCGLGNHYRRLAGADASGAITGAVTGAKTAGWAGVLPGAVFGAGIASLGSFVKSTWEIYWCAM